MTPIRTRSVLADYNSQQRSYVYDPVAARDPALAALFGVQTTTAGVIMDEGAALALSAYYSGVQLIATTIASMPLDIIKRTKTRGSLVDEDHYLNDLLQRSPNPLWTAFQWKERQITDVIQWGNAYNYVERWEGDNDAQVRYIWPLAASQVTPRFRKDGVKEYVYQAANQFETTRIFQEWEMLHIPGGAYNGLLGKSVIAYARQSLAFSSATERFGTAFFGNNGVPGAIIKHPAQLDFKAKRRLEWEWEERNKGPRNARRVTVLDENMDYVPIGVPPEDGQFLQTRQFQVREIARWLRVPPHMLYDQDPQAWSVESQGLDFLTHTITPWTDRIVGPSESSLFTDWERRSLSLRFNAERLLAMDKKTRFEVYSQGRNMGFYTLNDLMRAENRPLLDPEIGDMRIGPSTMKALGGTDPTTPVPAETIKAVIELLSPLDLQPASAATIIKSVIPSASDAVIAAILEGVDAYEEPTDPNAGSQVGDAGAGSGEADVLRPGVSV